ncbi:hypothetical protein [Chryseobacterium sp. 5_R23647]|uniref:hypothetical protein n=1 Tax=Chryseobacterium sp. 5_R23647 TaxID=2258964 RepID=UPI000E2256B7|nr:hypothetical protein [Chryseobacterium sp. 5_R23647]REC40510.1 hypothetical protein DRF69_18625 [Chryseobacterium sp. 5_R23647]
MIEAANNLHNLFNSDVINFILIIALVISAITLWLAFNMREKIVKANNVEEIDVLRMKQKPIMNVFFSSFFVCISIFILKLVLS